jgi:hypothetical protein
MNHWIGNAVWVYFKKNSVADEDQEDCMRAIRILFHDMFDMVIQDIDVYLYHTPTVYIVYLYTNREALFFTTCKNICVLRHKVSIRPIVLLVKKPGDCVLKKWEIDVNNYASIWKCSFFEAYTSNYVLLYTLYDCVLDLPILAQSSLCLDTYPIYSINNIVPEWAYDSFYNARVSIQKFVSLSFHKDAVVLDVARITGKNISNGVFIRLFHISHTDFHQIETTAIDMLHECGETTTFEFLKRMFVTNTKEDFDEWLSYTHKITRTI